MPMLKQPLIMGNPSIINKTNNKDISITKKSRPFLNNQGQSIHDSSPRNYMHTTLFNEEEHTSVNLNSPFSNLNLNPDLQMKGSIYVMDETKQF